MKLFRGSLRVLLSLGLLAGGMAGFVLMGQARPVPERPVDEVPETVEVAVVQAHDAGIMLTVDGVVVPYRELQIAAEATGRIVRKADFCRVGRPVRKDEFLLQIDPRDYRYEVARLEAELGQAANNLVELQVRIESAEQQLLLAKEDLSIQTRFRDRVRKLIPQNAATEADWDTAERNLLNSRIALQSHQDELRLLRASQRGLESGERRIEALLARARVDLERTAVLAPINGVITEVHAEQDDYVQEGTTVLVIRDGSRVDVRCSLQAKQMNWLWAAHDHQQSADSSGYRFPETPVRVVYTIDEQQFIWDGVLAAYDGGGVDEQTRMIRCRVHVQDPLQVRRRSASNDRLDAGPPTLMAGMFVEVQIHASPRQRLVRLPRSAVHPENLVWVVSDGQLSRRRVRIASTAELQPAASGDSPPDQLLVYEGRQAVMAGQRVVTSPLASPQNGAAVHTKASTASRKQ